jgi:hypothetical protein
MTRQPGHLNGSNNKNFQGSNENWRTGSTCVGFSMLAYVTEIKRPNVTEMACVEQHEYSHDLAVGHA